MLRAVLSSWTLFFGLLLISAGNGLWVVLLGTGANDFGFGNIATGIVMSGYFAGILLDQSLYAIWPGQACSRTGVGSHCVIIGADTCVTG